MKRPPKKPDRVYPVLKNQEYDRLYDWEYRSGRGDYVGAAATALVGRREGADRAGDLRAQDECPGIYAEPSFLAGTRPGGGWAGLSKRRPLSLLK